MRRLVINGEEVYELDENCLKEKRGTKRQFREGNGYRHIGNQRRTQTFAGESGEKDGAASYGEDRLR